MAEPRQLTKDPKSDPLLLRIRERYTYAKQEWKDIHEEGRLDMKAVAGDPWDEKDKQAREDAGRPFVSYDEINQYLNQAINNLRMNKRGIKVDPAGGGSDDKSATFIENRVRAIESDSKAQRNAYIPAFESAIQKSYGFFRLTREYLNDKSFDQQIVIKGILNADSVLFDPDCKEADWSDARYCFIVDPISREEYKRQYPDAEIRDFTSEDVAISQGMVGETQVVVAEYWEVEITNRTLVMIDSEQGPMVMFKDELPEELQKTKFSKQRVVEERKLCKYITNGVEILEETDQPGKTIPIIPVIGKELYVDEGSGPKRKLISMVRLARDPQMSMAFLASQQLEEFGMSPKAPFVGYEGQFEGNEDAWANVNKVPRGYLEIKPVTDGQGTLLPKPDRPQFIPNTQAFEMAKESLRRSIQSAMGISPLPTAAQRQNEKSGIALQHISSQEQIGSFHFTDNLDRALELAGKIILDWLPIVEDTERDVPLLDKKEDRSIVKINAPAQDPDTNETYHHDVAGGMGDHTVSISVGPSYQSQRQEASDFADNLIKAAPALLSQIGDLLVRMRNLGPIGDEIADRLTPPQFAKQGSAQQSQAQAAQMGQQLQQLHAYSQQLEGEVQQLKFEKQAKAQDNQAKMILEQMQNEVKVLIAEIQTKAQKDTERDSLFADIFKHLSTQAHEKEMAAGQQVHEAARAEQDAGNNSAMQAQAAEQRPSQ